jgi:DNA processing protein
MTSAQSQNTVDVRIVLAWASTPGLSLRRFWRALRAAGSPEALLSADPAEVMPHVRSRELARAVVAPRIGAETDRILEQAEKAGARILSAFEPSYPAALREISDPPLLLYARGRADRLSLPAVAIVGARKASRYGREVAARLAEDLSAAGVVVVSGLARGIDAAAHEAACPGAGGTVAVLGCGIDVDYPPENRDLRRRIEISGSVITEYAPGTSPSPARFPVRNRIIAGIAAATVIVEAAARSGSLITARLANDFGRDVFAVPGSIFHDNTAGTHALLRDGAILCRGATDVLQELFPALAIPERGREAAALDLPPPAAKLLALLRREEGGFPDELGESAGLGAPETLVLLCELELRGLVRATPDGRYEPLA